MVLGLPVLVWAVIHPVAGTAALLVLVVLHRAAGRVATRLRRRLRRGAVSVWLGPALRLTISADGDDGCRPAADCCPNTS